MHGDVVDMDGDGDLDVLMAAGTTPGGVLDVALHQVVWYENDGTSTWTKHVVQQPFPHAFEAQAADMDGDGDMDVVCTSFGQLYDEPVTNRGFLAWLENPGDPTVEFAMHMLRDDWEHVNQVIITDLDGNGLPDIAACAERYALDFRWFRNLGTASVPEPTSGVLLGSAGVLGGLGLLHRSRRSERPQGETSGLWKPRDPTSGSTCVSRGTHTP